MHGTSVRNTIFCMAQRSGAEHAALLDTRALRMLPRHNGSLAATGGRAERSAEQEGRRTRGFQRGVFVTFAIVIITCIADSFIPPV